MKQLKVRLSPQGRIDYFIVLDTLLEHRLGRENRFMDEFEGASARLEVFPEMGVEKSFLGVGLRQIVVWDYLIFYRVTDAEVVIERIIHGARDLDAAFLDD